MRPNKVVEDVPAFRFPTDDDYVNIVEQIKSEEDSDHTPNVSRYYKSLRWPDASVKVTSTPF